MNTELLKYAGGLMLVICGALSGQVMCKRLRQRAIMLEDYLRFLTQTQALIGYTAESAESILENVRGLKLLTPMLDNARSLMKGGLSFRDAWCRSVRDYISEKEERELICAFGETFGTGNISGELSKLELHKESAVRMQRELLEDIKIKKRLYRTMGTFCGVLAAVVLI